MKDYVDLYFLLPEFGFWDLRMGVERKFNMDLESWMISSDFLAVEDFTFLPKMVIPLSLDNLKSFYREEARKLAKKDLK